jgi:hypothetical protein
MILIPFSLLISIFLSFSCYFNEIEEALSFSLKELLFTSSSYLPQVFAPPV